jgi:asparagine synthase (glutamine-hydrolysing)
MCGLTGIFYPLSQKSVSSGLLNEMTDLIHHRGPDGEGFFFNKNHSLGLGHRRLSIVDLAGGSQPMSTVDGGLTTVFNGEIYNYHDLRNVLEILGYHFQSNSDTEVLLHGWREWKTKLPQYLRGMFSFALWDETDQTLFIARDRLGKKPLHYSFLNDGGIAFASEIKSLECLPSFDTKLDPTAIEDFFAYSYIPDPKSIYQKTAKLPGGHYLLIKQGQEHPIIKSYWDIHFDQTNQKNEKELKKECIYELTQAVRVRQMSDVPIGAFLSGGVDSSGVVALMACLYDNPINTFSIGFDDKNFDETQYAQMSATKYKTNHHHTQVNSNDFHLIDKMIDLFDEPFGDSSALPTYQLCQTTAKHLKVALSGDGGDELFAGYRRYHFHQKEEKIRSLLPNSVRKSIFGPLGKLYPKLDWAPRYLRAKQTFQELAASSADGYFMNISCMTDYERDSLFSPSFKKELQKYHAVELIRKTYKEAPTHDPVLKAQYTDLKTWLPGDILTKVDRASMASSLEVRAPMLDHLFLEWSAHLPISMKIQGTEGKYILKKSLEAFVPNDILYRPKMGFSVPLCSWFRGPLKTQIQEKLLKGTLIESNYFNPAEIERYVTQHLSGSRDHSRTLWLLMIFQAFLEKQQKRQNHDKSDQRQNQN